jgi:hypothetical protein
MGKITKLKNRVQTQLFHKKIQTSKVMFEPIEFKKILKTNGHPNGAVFLWFLEIRNSVF